MRYKLVSPLNILIPRKTKKDKKVSINLNIYRNLYFHVNNEVKKKYKQLMEEQIEKLPKFDQINLVFKLYKNSNRRIDKDNVICITKKYFYDALVEYGKLEDDNDDHIKTEISLDSEVDKKNGRVEIYIIPKYDNLSTFIKNK